MALLRSQTRYESLPAHQALLSLPPRFLTRSESLVALQDFFTAPLWYRTRHESVPAHKTPLSLSPCSLTPSESLVAPYDSWPLCSGSWLNPMSAGSHLLSLL